MMMSDRNQSETRRDATRGLTPLGGSARLGRGSRLLCRVPQSVLAVSATACSRPHNPPRRAPPLPRRHPLIRTATTATPSSALLADRGSNRSPVLPGLLTPLRLAGRDREGRQTYYTQTHALDEKPSPRGLCVSVRVRVCVCACVRAATQSLSGFCLGEEEASLGPDRTSGP